MDLDDCPNRHRADLWDCLHCRPINKRADTNKRTDTGVYPYIGMINKGYLGSLKSTQPWSKQKIFNAYIQSAQQGEYSLNTTEYDPYQSGLVQKQYFSGGVRLAIGQTLEIQVQESASPLNSQDKQDGLVLVKVSSPTGSDHFWKFNVVLVKQPEETPIMLAEEESASPLERKEHLVRKLVYQGGIIEQLVNKATIIDAVMQNMGFSSESRKGIRNINNPLRESQRIFHTVKATHGLFNIVIRETDKKIFIEIADKLQDIKQVEDVIKQIELKLLEVNTLFEEFVKQLPEIEQKAIKYTAGGLDKIQRNVSRIGDILQNGIPENAEYLKISPLSSPLVEKKQTPELGGIDLGDMEIEIKKK